MKRTAPHFLPAIASACLCMGCLGGEIDAPTWKPGQTRYLLLPLKAGDAWTFAQRNGGDSSATLELEILGDTLFEGVPAYIQALQMRMPDYVTDMGIDVRDYSFEGRYYLRKSDQEVLGQATLFLADVHFPGDPARIAYREEERVTAEFSGTLPDTLAPGASWSWTGSRHVVSDVYYDDSLVYSSDNTLPRKRTYEAFASAPVTVPAGTFEAIRIQWSDSGSTSSSMGWYSPAARTMVLQIDSYGGTADTTELAAYSLE